MKNTDTLFHVQLARTLDGHPLAPGTWFALTQKLNGIRAIYYDGNLCTRNGRVITGLDHIISNILRYYPDGMVLDGELTLADGHGLPDNEAFRTVSGLVRASSADKSSLQFTVFDILPATEFEAGASRHTYRQRRELMDSLSTHNTKCLKILPMLYSGTDQAVISRFLDQMVREDKEGLMVNLDVPYQCKRHNGLLKVKRFYTMDLPIVAYEEGTGRLSGALGALVIDYNGNHVHVGTGFTDDERLSLWYARNKLPGMICEVKYKEISNSKKSAAQSLQFPVFVTLRADKTEPNIERPVIPQKSSRRPLTAPQSAYYPVPDTTPQLSLFA